MSVKQMVGDQLMKALDVIDDNDDSVVVYVEISSGRATDQVPALCHEFTLRVLDGEWQESSHRERWRTGGSATRR
jgi:hypothetical protein